MIRLPMTDSVGLRTFALSNDALIILKYQLLKVSCCTNLTQVMLGNSALQQYIS